MRPIAEPVGPVLLAGSVADAVIAAIRASNAGVRVQDRGAYAASFLNALREVLETRDWETELA